MRALLLAIFVLLVPSAAPAQDGGRKVALVIANGTYAQAGALTNPVNDATLVAAAAKNAGFDRHPGAATSRSAGSSARCAISVPRPTERRWRWSTTPGTGSRARARTG